MNSLTASELLDLVDRGSGAGQVERGLLLLRHAQPSSDASALAGLPVGERDRRLIQLRTGTFGPVAPARTTCPDCGAELETVLHLPTMVAASSPGSGSHTVTHNGRTAVFRLPTSADLRAVPAGLDRAQAKAALLAACVQSVDGEPAAAVPVDLAGAVVAAMAAADPLLDVELDLRCGECGCAWAEAFDIVTFFWAEVQARARRLLGDVHGLARAYGWSEAEILALSPQRREQYLALARS